MPKGIVMIPRARRPKPRRKETALQMKERMPMEPRLDLLLKIDLCFDLAVVHLFSIQQYPQSLHWNFLRIRPYLVFFGLVT